MIKYENWCVGCPDGMPCLGSSCPYINVTVYYCDSCGCDGAEYEYDGEDICQECLNKLLIRKWGLQDIEEKKRLLSVEEDFTEEELDDLFDTDFTLNEKIELFDMYVIKR
jgi:hypothetical protein